MLCPTAPSLPWVAWASLPHVPRYYAPLRLPPPRLGGFACRSPSRYLACFQGSWFPSRAHDRVETLDHARAFDHPVPLSGYMVKETGGSPTFPSSPSGDMPRSQTPVVSCALAIAHPGLLPSSACKLSAFPSRPLKDLLLSTTIPISGLNHAACLLATPGFVRPLTGRHAGSLLTGWLGVSQVGFAPCGRSPTG
jgi:hypothetical protein